MLIIAERVGKAIRTPARDAMLSHATKEVGHGWGFGLHEALDQAGAVFGPIVVAAVLYSQGGYRRGFGVLLVPALLALSVLMVAWRLYPRPRDLETTSEPTGDKTFPRTFWLYLAGAALIAAGYVDFPLIAYHFGRRETVPAGSIPLFYAFAMGVDALAALIFGALLTAEVLRSSSSPPFCLRSSPRSSSSAGFTRLSSGWRSGASAWGLRKPSCGPQSRGWSRRSGGDPPTGSSTPAMGSPGSSEVP